MNINFAKHKSIMTTCLTIVLSITFSILTVQYFHSKFVLKKHIIDGVLSILRLSISIHVNIFNCLQFIWAVLNIRSRMNMLNNNLVALLIYQKNKKNISLIHKPWNFAKKINNMSKLYAKLMRAIDVVNSVFSMQLISFISYTMLANVFQLFDIFNHFRSGKKFYDLLNTSIDTFWALHFDVYLLIVIHVAHSTIQRGPKTVALIYKIINDTMDEETLNMVGCT